MTRDDEFYEGLGYGLGIFPADRAGLGPPCEDVDEDHDVFLPVGGGEWAEDVTDDFLKGTRGGEWCKACSGASMGTFVRLTAVTAADEGARLLEHAGKEELGRDSIVRLGLGEVAAERMRMIRVEDNGLHRGRYGETEATISAEV